MSATASLGSQPQVSRHLSQNSRSPTRVVPVLSQRAVPSFDSPLVRHVTLEHQDGGQSSLMTSPQSHSPARTAESHPSENELSDSFDSWLDRLAASNNDPDPDPALARMVRLATTSHHSLESPERSSDTQQTTQEERQRQYSPGKEETLKDGLFHDIHETREGDSRAEHALTSRTDLEPFEPSDAPPVLDVPNPDHRALRRHPSEISSAALDLLSDHDPGTPAQHISPIDTTSEMLVDNVARPEHMDGSQALVDTELDSHMDDDGGPVPAGRRGPVDNMPEVYQGASELLPTYAAVKGAMSEHEERGTVSSEVEVAFLNQEELPSQSQIVVGGVDVGQALVGESVQAIGTIEENVSPTNEAVEYPTHLVATRQDPVTSEPRQAAYLKEAQNDSAEDSLLSSDQARHGTTLTDELTSSSGLHAANGLPVISASDDGQLRTERHFSISDAPKSASRSTALRSSPERDLASGTKEAPTPYDEKLEDPQRENVDFGLVQREPGVGSEGAVGAGQKDVDEPIGKGEQRLKVAQRSEQVYVREMFGTAPLTERREEGEVNDEQIPAAQHELEAEKAERDGVCSKGAVAKVEKGHALDPALMEVDQVHPETETGDTGAPVVEGEGAKTSVLMDIDSPQHQWCMSNTPVKIGKGDTGDVGDEGGGAEKGAEVEMDVGDPQDQWRVGKTPGHQGSHIRKRDQSSPGGKLEINKGTKRSLGQDMTASADRVLKRPFRTPARVELRPSKKTTPPSSPTTLVNRSSSPNFSIKQASSPTRSAAITARKSQPIKQPPKKFAVPRKIPPLPTTKRELLLVAQTQPNPSPPSSPSPAPGRHSAKTPIFSKGISKPFKMPLARPLVSLAPTQSAKPPTIREQVLELETQERTLRQAIKYHTNPDEDDRLVELIKLWREAGQEVSTRLLSLQPRLDDSASIGISASTSMFGSDGGLFGSLRAEGRMYEMSPEEAEWLRNAPINDQGQVVNDEGIPVFGEDTADDVEDDEEDEGLVAALARITAERSRKGAAKTSASSTMARSAQSAYDSSTRVSDDWHEGAMLRRMGFDPAVFAWNEDGAEWGSTEVE